MEKTNARVLAYQLSNYIPDEALKDISGGNGASFTSVKTFKITGPFYSPDAEIDYSADW